MKFLGSTTRIIVAVVILSALTLQACSSGGKKVHKSGGRKSSGKMY